MTPETYDEESRSREAALDRTIEGSFPASDPPSSIPNPYDRSEYPKRESDHMDHTAPGRL